MSCLIKFEFTNFRLPCYIVGLFQFHQMVIKTDKIEFKIKLLSTFNRTKKSHFQIYFVGCKSNICITNIFIADDDEPIRDMRKKYLDADIFFVQNAFGHSIMSFEEV